MKKLFPLFLFLISLLIYSCSSDTRATLNKTLDNYDKKIDSFSVLLNTFNDPSPDTVIQKIRNLENEFSQLILLSDNEIESLLKQLKTIPKNRKHLEKRYLELRLKANLLMQKIISTKTKHIVARLEEVKKSLSQTYQNIDNLGPAVNNSIQEWGNNQLTEIDQTIKDIQDKMTIQLDSLNRQFLELKKQEKK
ncbi:MAG TPA: hypothetical protein P5050_07510 [Bacteroidia bacterium]|nr:hypothetical protein [Bacteroidia bacterium]HRS59051.1 hypothetical protein [Bacteroidia bacterium]HRU69285.1 hypothetical protein [Bacteroidia bacterium]